MKRIHTLAAALIGACCLINQAGATAANTTAAAAVSYDVGQGWVSHYFDENNTNRWFKFTTVGGRSYCIEASQGSDTHIALNPNVTYYSDAAGTAQVATNDTGLFEPPMTLGARTCFVDSTALDTRTVRTVKVNVPLALGTGDNGYARLRIFDTTIMTPRLDWNVNTLNGDASTWSHTKLDFVNSGDTAVTVTYQSRKNCGNYTTTNYCGAANPSGSVSLPARSRTNVYLPPTDYTNGSAWVVVGVPSPTTRITAYVMRCNSGGAWCPTPDSERLNY